MHYLGISNNSASCVTRYFVSMLDPDRTIHSSNIFSSKRSLGTSPQIYSIFGLQSFIHPSIAHNSVCHGKSQSYCMLFALLRILWQRYIMEALTFNFNLSLSVLIKVVSISSSAFLRPNILMLRREYC